MDESDIDLKQYELTSEKLPYKYTYRGFNLTKQNELIDYVNADKLVKEQKYVLAWDKVKNFSKTDSIAEGIILDILNGVLEKEDFPLVKMILDERLIENRKGNRSYNRYFYKIALRYAKLNGSSVEAIFPLEEIDCLKMMIVELQKQNASLSQRVERLEQQIKK